MSLENFLQKFNSPAGLDWRDTLVRHVLRAAAVFSVPVAVAAVAVFFSFTLSSWFFLISAVTICATLFILAFSRRVPYRVRAVGLIVAIYALGFLALIISGRGSAGLAFLMCGAFLTALFLGTRASLFAAVLNILILGVFAALFLSNRLTIMSEASSTVPSGWVLTLLISLLLNAVLVLSTNYVINSLTTLLNQSQALARDLATTQAALEQRVAERTRAAEEAQREAERARAEAEHARQVVEAQAWRADGALEVSASLSGEQAVEMLANNVTRALCSYLDAQVAVCYLRTGESLNVAGGYAYVPRPDLPTRFRIGEGLVGQVAREGLTHILTDVPPEALAIATGLGVVKPSSVVLLPCLHNGRVFVLIELAALHVFSVEHIEFLNSVSTSIAVAFETAYARTQINELLAETQHQAEEMQAQEEELRAINEELQAQAESLQAQSPATPWRGTR